MGVRHVVKVSVAGGPDSGTQIGRWHWATETQLKDSGLAFTILRPTSYMQQMFLFAPTIAATGSFALPMGTGAVAVVDTRDVAAVGVRALTEAGHERKIYDLTGPAALTFDEMADELSLATGKKIEYVHVPPDYARKHLLAARPAALARRRHDGAVRVLPRGLRRRRLVRHPGRHEAVPAVVR